MSWPDDDADGDSDAEENSNSALFVKFAHARQLLRCDRWQWVDGGDWGVGCDEVKPPSITSYATLQLVS